MFEDSQSDPRQAVAIAQKFVADSRIILELGDSSSPALMAASPIYQRAGPVQFGFTNSHPDFTKGGDCMWSTSISQSDEQPKLAEYAIKDLGLSKLAVLHLNRKAICRTSGISARPWCGCATPVRPASS